MSAKSCSAALRLGLVLLVAFFAGGLVLAFFLAAAPARAAVTTLPADPAAIRSLDGVTTYVYLPLVSRFDPCAPIPGESYDVLFVLPLPIVERRRAGQPAGLAGRSGFWPRQGRRDPGRYPRHRRLYGPAHTRRLVAGRVSAHYA